MRSVESQLEVDLVEDRKDAEIQRDVESALRRDVYLVSPPIRVPVEAGWVRLTGVARAAFERERAGVEAG